MRCRACPSQLWLPQCSSALQDCLAVSVGVTFRPTQELPAGHSIAEPSSSKTGRCLVKEREYFRYYKNTTSRDLEMKVINWWQKINYPRGWVFPLFSQEVKMHSSLSGCLSHGDFRAGSHYSGCWERAKGALQNWKLPHFVLTATSDLGRASSSRDRLCLTAKPAANVPAGPVSTESGEGARSAPAVPRVTQQSFPLRGSPRHDCNQH